LGQTFLALKDPSVDPWVKVALIALVALGALGARSSYRNAAGNKELRPALRSLEGGDEPFNPTQLAKLEAKLTEEGVALVTGDEGARLANNLGGEALYIPEVGRPGIIAWGKNPSRAAVVEEIIHFGQHRRLGFGDISSQIIKLEIQAQLRLLRIGKILNWSEAELARIQRALETWRSQL
jgi:hypothetical protein